MKDNIFNISFLQQITMSATVKVFFEKADGSVEIRRFIVNTTDSDFFTTTKEKIKRLYTVLANSKFTLFWQGQSEIMFQCY